MCQEQNLRVINSYYPKRWEHLITYKSGDNETQTDYVLCRRHEELRIKNGKKIPGEVCLTQHRLVWAEVVIKGRKECLEEGRKKIRAWKLNDPIKRRMFEVRVSDRIEKANVEHAGLLNAMLNSA